MLIIVKHKANNLTSYYINTSQQHHKKTQLSFSIFLYILSSPQHTSWTLSFIYKMSIVYTHALNYSQLESSLVDTTSIGFIMNEETFTNDNHQYYSPSTSSDMDAMFTNSQNLLVKQEEKEPFSSHYNGYSSNQIIYQTQQQNQGLPNDFDGSFSAVNSLDSVSYYETETKIDSSKNCSNLIRHKSSPAEFFSNYPLHNGTMNFSSDSWDTSTFNVPKTSTMNGEIMFSTSNALETQDLNFGYQKLGLSHHLSLPSSSTKMNSMDKFFHIQGTVPCKIRAKRGFATHPRSIAERERRIRISARIKKLQDLFPNSDKQSSTADMLDVAVDYIKDLRKQLKILSDNKAKCSCTSN